MNQHHKKLKTTQDIQKRIKFLFLIDGFGALTSALLLGFVLVQFNEYFGIPISTLYFLAALPCVFAVYDFVCYFTLKTDLGPALKRIAIVNWGYGFLSLGFAIYHVDLITTLGWAYVLGEIGIVGALALVELRNAKTS